MNVALPDEMADVVSQLVATGRFGSPVEVVGAGLKALQATKDTELVFPPGSLSKLYTPEENLKERATAGASSLKVEPE
jgi:Arc/MetJ-type ribon-helix-helix transcriptional regulator